MTIRVFLLFLALVSLPTHADNEDAATLERMGYTKEWLRANGYSSYQEYRNHQRQQDTQRRQQEFERQQSQRALELEQMRLQTAEAQREAAIALEQAITSSRYFSLLPRPLIIGPGMHWGWGNAAPPGAGGLTGPRPGDDAFPHDVDSGHGHGHVDTHKGSPTLAPAPRH